MSDFATSVERLLNRVKHWEEPRWRGKSDRTYAVIQHLANLTADAESRPRHPVPREHDMLLPDQLRVMADDLLAANPPPPMLTEATAEVESLQTTL